MSFSSDAKAEICRQPMAEKCCSLAECYGILLYCNTFSGSSVRIVTESAAFAARLPKLFRRSFGFEFDGLPGETAGGKCIFTIEDPKKLERVFDAYGYDRGQTLAHHINFGVIEEDCCRHSFMRGAFLAGGSVTDPQKRYHLELVTAHYNVSRETYSVLLDMEFEPKSTARNGNYITYFKQSESIEDFLTTVGAPVAAMGIMSAKIIKDMTNSVNRRVNCDTANVTKTVEAAGEQLDAIRKIAAAKGIGHLPDKLRQTAELRLENPELSLTELCRLFQPPVTKSCLSHRLRRLVDIAGEL